MPASDPVRVRVPAKVNLHLGVGRRRPDGYHDVVTVLHAVGLFDVVSAQAGPGLSVQVGGEGAGSVPVDGSNLALRAARLLAEHTGADPAARLMLNKSIPVAGGMAGGSADAAAALVACDGLWRTGMTRTGLHALAARLGSDVPFLLDGGTALGTGRGDVLTRVLGRGSFTWVLALADGGLSTPEVYAQHDRLRGERAEPAPPEPVLAALRTGDVAALGAALHNDLEPAAVALRPELAATLRAGRELGAAGGVVSGSGPTCAFLARSHAAGLDLAAALMSEGVCRDVRVAAGPVGGARVA